MRRHRSLLVLRGEPPETAARARRAVADLPDHEVCWLDRIADARRLLGGSVSAVVLSLHDGIDADLLGAAHGLVRGGGTLILRAGNAPSTGPLTTRLAVWPHTAADVGDRLERRLWDRLRSVPSGSPRLAPEVPGGSAEQDALVAALRDGLDGPAAVWWVTADRGRGKSTGVGRALQGRPAVLTGADARATSVLAAVSGLSWTAPREVGETDVLVVDEAARLPLPVLQDLLRTHPGAHVVLVSTTRGYEGSGGGLQLRLGPWLERDPRPQRVLRLDTPIRWDPHDPLEAALFDALALDADVAPAAAVAEASVASVVHERLDRDVLAGDERLLREVFGLLRVAHYRTTPSDLHRLLDAPNLEVHVLRHDGHVVAANLLAHEGALPAVRVAAAIRGDLRLAGHALADALAVQGGHAALAQRRLVRSVRVATHPSLRRRGLAAHLIEATHRTVPADHFGTLFGATPALVGFRRALGYEVVRLGSRRGDRTGLPSVVMLRGDVAGLRAQLAADLPVQLAYLAAEAPLDPGLTEALTAGLPTTTLVDGDRALHRYAHGPASQESAAAALRAWLDRHPGWQAKLPPSDVALITARVVELQSWRAVAERAGTGVRGAMRALRRAVAVLLSDPPAAPEGEPHREAGHAHHRERDGVAEPE